MLSHVSFLVRLYPLNDMNRPKTNGYFSRENSFDVFWLQVLIPFTAIEPFRCKIRFSEDKYSGSTSFNTKSEKLRLFLRLFVVKYIFSKTNILDLHLLTPNKKTCDLFEKSP